MKNLLITGSSGFLGSKIIEKYKENYHLITPSHHEMDITNEISVQHYFLKHRPDIVIHCAAISDTNACQQNPDLSYRVNVAGSENIAKAAKMVSAKCIMCSSDQVYCGSQKDTANTEDDALFPHNVYGKDKAYTETSCLQIYPESVHLRLAWMYDSKADLTSPRNDFFKQLKTCIAKATPINLPVNDKRGITDVWEVVDNIEKTFALPGGVYNFGSANTNNTYDMTVSVFEALNLDSSLLNKISYDRARNISMSQEKLNGFRIYFTDTADKLINILDKGTL